MKNTILVGLMSVSFLFSCEKEHIVKNENQTPTTEGIEKEAGNNKRKLFCQWVGSDGKTVLANGTRCSTAGDECGRGSYCVYSHGPSKLAEEKIMVDERLNLREFIDYTQTEEGVNYLYSLGYHYEDIK